MSETPSKDARERVEDRKRQAARGKKARLKKYIVLGCIAIVVLCGAIVLHTMSGEPGQVTGLEAEATYSMIHMKWDEVSGADGYYVYASVDENDPVVIGETKKGECEYDYTEYDNKEEYEVCIAAYNKTPITGEIKEGHASEGVILDYDASKYAQKIPIITYHKIVPAGTEFETTLLVAEDTFDEHMKYLHDNGYTTLTPDEFYEWYQGRREFPKKTVMVTFDDGYYGTYYLAYPIIKKYDQAATVFCIGKNIKETTDPFDPEAEKDHYIGKDLVEGMREEYPRFAFESHTFNMHNRIKGKQPAMVFSAEETKADCEKNAEFGFKYLAWPWGVSTEESRKGVEESGYNLAFGYRPFYYALRSDDPFNINRVKISGKIDFERFKTIVSGENPEFDNPDAPENQPEEEIPEDDGSDEIDPEEYTEE